MKVLVLGSGAREHALAWKIGNSPQCERVFLHPGNAGTRMLDIPSLGDVPVSNLEALLTSIRREKIDFIVIGPEGLLAEGVSDFFRAHGLEVFGPNQRAAQLESSKIFAKRFMVSAGIPTADFEVATDKAELDSIFEKKRFAFPCVLKLDGLAAGKGVVVANNLRDVEVFAERVWEKKEFGSSSSSILIEECLKGRELSYIGLCDGQHFIPLASASDYKRIGDFDTGPNTGGMGCVSPSPFLTHEVQKKIQTEIVQRLLEGLKKQGLSYSGALYIGVMVDAKNRPFVLEFNARFGDPETQAVLLRLESDFLQMCLATSKGRLSELSPPHWKDEPCVYLVASAFGYPEKVRTKDKITGIDKVSKDVQVFFAGVSTEQGALVTSGGRVLGVGGLGKDMETARAKVYSNMKRIFWDGMHYRNDIAVF